MAKIFPFDKREAESYARALRKQREREAKASEERDIWNQLVDEQIQRDRERDAANGHKVARQPREKLTPLTDRERGLAALRHFIKAVEERANLDIAIIEKRAPLPYHNGRQLDWPIFLAMMRHRGRGVHQAIEPIAWWRQAEKLLGKDKAAAVMYPISGAACAKVRRAAREALRNEDNATRRRAMDALKSVRQIGLRNSLDLAAFVAGADK